MNNQNIYFSALTSMRGVAALGVVLFHCLAILPQVAQQMPALFSTKGYLWVDFFFVLSGFVLAHSNGKKFAGSFAPVTYKSFIVARFARIYPAYIVVLALFVLLEFLAQTAAIARFGEDIREAFFAGPYAPEALLSNILMLQSVGVHDQLTWNMPGWSLSAEWLVYLLVPLIFYFFYGCGYWACVLLAALSIGGLLGLQYSLGRDDLDITYDFGALRCLLEVALGYALCRLRSVGALVDSLRGDMAALLVLFAIPLGMYLSIPDVGIVCLFALAIVVLSLNDGRVQAFFSVKPLLFIGTISYSIYLVQWLLFRAVKLYLAIYLDTNPAEYFSPSTGWIFVASIIVGSISMGGLLYWRVERPMHDRVRRTLL